MVSIASLNDVTTGNDATSCRVFTSVIIIASGRTAFFSHMIRVLQFHSRSDVLVCLISFSRFDALRSANVERSSTIVSSFRVLFGMNGQRSDCVLTGFYFKICMDWQAGRGDVYLGLFFSSAA